MAVLGREVKVEEVLRRLNELLIFNNKEGSQGVAGLKGRGGGGNITVFIVRECLGQAFTS